MSSLPTAAPTPRVTVRLRVLIAEDNRVNAILAMRLVEHLGHEARAVPDGARAVAAVLAGDVDAVLMDVQMPALDGFEATRRIRQWEAGHGGRMPIIALTANAQQDDVQRCLAAGMDDYLSKPILSERLAEVLAWASRIVGQGAIDRAALRVRVGGGAEALREVCQSFAAAPLRLLAELDEAMAAGDAGAVARTAQHARGALSAMCARASAELAQSLVEAAAAGELSACAPFLGALREELTRLGAELAALAAMPTDPAP